MTTKGKEAGALTKQSGVVSLNNPEAATGNAMQTPAPRHFCWFVKEALLQESLWELKGNGGEGELLLKVKLK